MSQSEYNLNYKIPDLSNIKISETPNPAPDKTSDHSPFDDFKHLTKRVAIDSMENTITN
jgi:hypothetical protein